MFCFFCLMFYLSRFLFLPPTYKQSVTRKYSLEACSHHNDMYCSYKSEFVHEPKHISYASNGIQGTMKCNVNTCNLQHVYLDNSHSLWLNTTAMKTMSSGRISHHHMKSFRLYSDKKPTPMHYITLLGRTLVTTCGLGQEFDFFKTHPMHFLVGIGSVVGQLANTQYDNIVLYHCSSLFNMPFKRFVIKIFLNITSLAEKNVFIMSKDSNPNIFPNRENFIIQDMYYNRMESMLPFSIHVTDTLIRQFQQTAFNIIQWYPPKRDNLRIAIFQRTTGTSLRTFENLNRVRQVALEYTSDACVFTA